MRKMQIPMLNRESTSPLHNRENLHDDLIRQSHGPLTAKLALIESHYQKQKRKTKALQHSLLTQTSEMRNLQLQIARLQAQCSQTDSLLQQISQKNQEINFYQDSLEMIKKEMESLNENIYRKNNQFIYANQQIEILQQENLHLKQDNAAFANTTRTITQQMRKIVSILPHSESLRRYSSSNNLIDEFIINCEMISQTFNEIEQEKENLIALNQRLRHEYSEKLIKEKEKSVKLEFQKKLLEQRQNDQQKHQTILRQDQRDRRIEQLELQLLKVEQQKEKKLQEISSEKSHMEDRFIEETNEKQTNNSQHINSLTKRIRELEKERKDLKAELEKIKQKYKNLTEKYSKLNLDMLQQTNSNQFLGYMKQLRTAEQEKKKLEIRVDELLFKNKILEQQLEIYQPKK